MRSVYPTATVRIAIIPAVHATPGSPPNKRIIAATKVMTATRPGALTMSERRGSRVAAATIPDAKRSTPNA
jgi:hypothetical protein